MELTMAVNSYLLLSASEVENTGTPYALIFLNM